MQPTPHRPESPAFSWSRVLGALIICAGILGLALSLGGLIFITIASGSAEAALMRELDTIDRSLATTNEGLIVADSALAEAETTLGSLSNTLNSATRAITETRPTIGSLQELAGTGLPQTIEATRQALDGAQDTAVIVDNVLGTLAIFGVSYNPEVPLNIAIGRISDSLSGLPASLEEVATGLGTAGDSLTSIAGDLEQVATGLDAIAVSVGEATTVIEQYQTIVGDLRGEIALVREGAPVWIMAARIAFSLLMIWLALAQIGLLTQGWELMGRPTIRR
jgi:methyl-accepting chemotaxis protein